MFLREHIESYFNSINWRYKMDIQELGKLVNARIEESKADVLIIVHNDNLGTVVYPFWGQNEIYNSKQDMFDDLIITTASYTLNYAEKIIIGETIGAFAMKWPEERYDKAETKEDDNQGFHL